MYPPAPVVAQKQADYRGQIRPYLIQLSWAQNYLGAKSDMMRQLAVSSVPVYYLIGLDGKLVGSANVWEEMKEILDGQFKQ